MTKLFLCSAVMFVAGVVLAADAKDDVTAAAKKLGEKANYSWTTTVVAPEGARRRPGPTDGKAGKDGLLSVKMSFGDNTTEIFKKGDKAAFVGMDGEWQSLADAENDEGPGRFMAGMVLMTFMLLLRVWMRLLSVH